MRVCPNEGAEEVCYMIDAHRHYPLNCVPVQASAIPPNLVNGAETATATWKRPSSRLRRFHHEG
jgi:hypothetical protein